MVPPRNNTSLGEDDTPSKSELMVVRMQLKALEERLDDQMERMRSVDAALASIGSGCATVHKRHSEVNARIIEKLDGSPSSPEKGLVVRMDRVEQGLITKKQLWMAVLMLFFGMLVSGFVTVWVQTVRMDHMQQTRTP